MAPKRVFVHATTPALLSAVLKAGWKDVLVPPALAKAANGARPFVLEDDAVQRAGRRIGQVARVRSPRDERALRRLQGTPGWLFVEARDWRVIPFENLVAAFQGTPKIAAFAHDVEDARLLLATLERGVEGVVVRPRGPEDLAALEALRAGTQRSVPLEAWRVEKVEDVDAGERVCVDTVHLLRPDEGLLVGSTSRAFFLVASEARHGRYVRARPFRVNAGAVHSYVWGPGSTHYLSEVGAGTRLHAVDARGRLRPVVVGRAKIETRPLRIVHARGPSGSGSVVVQNAETVRLMAPDRKPLDVTRLRPGARVLVRPEASARHTGLPVQERIVER